MTGEVAGTRIRSVTRAAALLALVATMPEAERTVARISAQLETSLPTTYHLLNTLVDAGLLYRTEHKRYVLGRAVGVLCRAYLAEPDMVIRSPAGAPPSPQRVQAG